MIRRAPIKTLLPALALASSAALFGAAVAPAPAGASKRPRSGVEAPSGGTVTETGSTLLYPLFNLWASGYGQKYPDVTIQTAGTGSGTGISNAASGTVEVGASDAYLSPSEKTASPNLLNIPLAISAQLIAYNIPGVTAHLKLNGRLLSAIYQGKITRWNDPAIAKLNPGVTLPDLKIVTLHRSDSSGDTFLFTTLLSKTDASGWETKIGYNTTVPWPNAPGALGETGNSGMVAGCKATPGCVAYVGISYETQALQSGLAYAELQNGGGQYVLPTSATIAAGAAAFTKKTPADGTISMIYGPSKAGYPIINYEYAVVDKAQPSSNGARNVRSVLEWAVNKTEGSSSQYLDQVDFQPLPSSVAAQSLKQIQSIH